MAMNAYDSARQTKAVLEALGYSLVGTTTKGGLVIQHTFFNNQSVEVVIDYTYTLEGGI